jgi:hypothetical protein
LQNSHLNGRPERHHSATSATTLSGTTFEGGVRDVGGAALVSAGAFGGVHCRVGDVDQIVDEFTLGGVEARAQRGADDADAGRNGEMLRGSDE